MAIDGGKIIACSTDSQYYLRFYWNRTGINTPLAQSYINVAFYVGRYSPFWDASRNLNLTDQASIIADGENSGVWYSKHDTRPLAYNALGYNNESYLGTKSFTIQHNDDGTKPSFTISATLVVPSGCGGVSGTNNISESFELDTIPRAATISSFPNFNIGINTILNISNLGGLYNTLDFKVTYNSIVYTVKSLEGILSGNISTLITASDLYSKCPDSNTLQVTAELKTWTNSSKTTQVGSTQTANANALVTNSNPVFTDFSFADIDAIIRSATPLTDSNQKFINGYSDARATISIANKAVAQNYATMDKYELTIGTTQTNEADYSSDSIVNIDIANVLSGTIKVKAIDSRGNSTTVIKSAAALIEYAAIILSNVEVKRDNGVDSTVKLTATGIVDLVNFGAVVNTLKSVTYQYKLTSSETWVDGETEIDIETDVDIDGSGNITISNIALDGDIGSSGFTAGKSFDFNLIFTDELSSQFLTTAVEGLIVMERGVDYSGEEPVPVIGFGGINNLGYGVQSFIGFYDAYGGQIMPVGAIILWPLSVDNIPTGWILANGATNLSRATYAKLFALYQTTFGNADANTFGVPDLRGLVPVGYKSGDSDFGTLNGTGGSKLLQQHNHGIAGGGGTIQSMQYVAYVMGASGSAGNRTDTIANAGTGNSGNLQPYRVVNYIIKY